MADPKTLTTAEVRATPGHQDCSGDCDCCQYILETITLPLAEERDRLAAEVTRLREVIAAKYAIERSSLGVPALVEKRESAVLRAEAAERERDLARDALRRCAAAVLANADDVNVAPVSVVVAGIEAAVFDRVQLREKLREIERERDEALRAALEYARDFAARRKMEVDDG